MKDFFRYAIILAIVTMVSAGSLAWINQITLPRILEQQARQLNEGLFSVLPGTVSGLIVPVQQDGETQFYAGYADTVQENLIGYAYLNRSNGYSSTIQTLVGIDTTGKILGIRVLFQQETPGLGTRCEEVRSGESTPWWQDQFIGMIASDVSVDKDGGEIESITGATITSRAIADGIAQQAISTMDRIRMSPATE
jgi:electron transport complex protein RnfG